MFISQPPSFGSSVEITVLYCSVVGVESVRRTQADTLQLAVASGKLATEVTKSPESRWRAPPKRPSVIQVPPVTCPVCPFPE